MTDQNDNVKWPADKIERRKVEDLIPYARNSRTHSDEQIAQIAASIKEWGWTTPVLIDEDGEIIAGHGRVMAARKLDIDEIPTMTAVGWTKAQKQAYVLADNQLPQNAGWDMDLLKVEIMDLNLEGFDLSLMGFNDDMMAGLLTEETEGLTDEDAVPELTEDPITKLGDIWTLGNHRLMCGDSTSIDAVDKLMDGRKADMVFTDPPYGIEFTDLKGNGIKNDNLNDKNLSVFNKDWQLNADLASKGDCFLMAWQSPRKFYLLDYDSNWSFFRLVTMYKSNRISFPHGAWINKTEPCCIFAKGNPRITKQKYLDDCYVYTHDKESHEDSNVGHPTPKPVKMIECHVVACAKQDDVVLDLFGGSGSTMIACEKTGRECYMMELDPKYSDVIIKRWQDFTGNDATLNGKKYNDMI